VSSFNFFVFARFTRVASSFINSRISRISTKRRFKILIVSKIDEFSRNSRDVMNEDDDEKSNVKNDNRSNCIRYCRISIDCRRSRISNAINVSSRKLLAFRYVLSSCVNVFLFNSRRFQFVFVSSFINCLTFVSFYASIKYH
jgi:hypothetical protein